MKIDRFIEKIILKNQNSFLYNKFLYELARRYTLFYRGESNSDMSTNGEYNFLTKLFKKYKIKTVFDVGANIGDYTDKILDLSSSVVVHCFEPSNEAFEFLKKKAYPQRIVLNNIALSNFEGERKYFVKKGHTKHGSFYRLMNEHVGVKPKNVFTTSLDNYCIKNKVKNIDLLKIDTEGHEYKILMGAKKLLKSSSIDIVHFEYGYASIYARVFFKDIYELFCSYGYQLYKIKPFKIEKIAYNVEHEGCPYANFIASRKSIKI